MKYLSLYLRDRLRTAINVLGDGFGAGIVYHLSKHELEKMDEDRKLECLESVIQVDHDSPPSNNDNDDSSDVKTLESKV